MHTKVTILLLALCCFVIASAITKYHEGNIAEKFKNFIHRYGKQYSSPKEFSYRYNNFVKTLKRIDDHNSLEGDNIHGITKFADLSPEEFKNRYLMKNLNPTSDELVKLSNGAPPPATFDWREHGAVTPVYDQGQCGSPWAFTATETIESAWFIANHSLESFSAQQVVSCAKRDDGCNGGLVNTAFDYIMNAGGLELTSDYPYTSSTGENGKCKFNDSLVVGKLSSFSVVSKAPNNMNETAMIVAVSSVGPLSVYVDAETWATYTGGIVRKCQNTSVDHTAVIVGYNTTEAGIDYWIVRNSWGTDWGISGYIYIERHHDLCEINCYVIYPVVPKNN